MIDLDHKRADIIYWAISAAAQGKKTWREAAWAAMREIDQIPQPGLVIGCDFCIPCPVHDGSDE